MEIKEIDPEEAMFLNLKQEGISGKLQGFLQIRQHKDYPAYQPQARPIQKPSQIDSVAEKVGMKTIPQPQVHEPIKPPVLDIDDLLFEPVTKPVAVSESFRTELAMPTPAAPVPTPGPIAITDLTPEEIYGTGRGIALPKFKLPSFRKQGSPVVDAPVQYESRNYTAYVRPALQVLGGIILVWFGLTSTGSYFQPMTRFTGILAKVFYEYQLGTVIVMAGVLLVYHTLAKRTGKV